MVGPEVPPKARKYLRAFLKRELIREEESDERWTARTRRFCAMLKEAIDGIDELDIGGYPGIFDRIPLKTRGKLPAKARRLERTAVESVALLHAMGTKVGKAKQIVAESYGKTIEVIDQWRKTAQNNSSAERPHIRMQMYKFYKDKPGSPFSKEHVLTQIARDGEAYKKARTKKKKAK